MKSHILALVIILFCSILISIPLLTPGLFTIHDDQQIARLFLFDQALIAGQFPVRWVDGIGFGFGYPLFNFYPPFVYALGEVFHLVGFGFIDSIKLVIFTSFLTSAISMYVLANYLWGKQAATVASIFYMLAPYRAIDVYVRGALAESFSFVWLPLILWSFLKLAKTNSKKYVSLSAFFLALLMITHNLIFLPFALPLSFLIIYLLVTSKNKKDTFISFTLAGFLAIGLSAFFWLPSLLEKKFTIVDDLLLVNLASYKIHFVSISQLWNWPWGFGGSTEGIMDGISFKIGKLHIVLSLLAFVLSVIALARKVNKKASTVIVFFALLTFSAFMTTSYSTLVWDFLPPFAYLQFPWRFLTFTTLFSSLLAAAFIYTLKVPILKIILTPTLILLVLLPNLKLFQPQAYRENLTDDLATSDETVKWYVSNSSFEYSPKGIQLKKTNLGTNVVDIKREEIAKQKISANPLIKVDNLEEEPHSLKFNLNAQADTKVTINTFNFPGWEARVNNQKVEITDDNKFKLITFSVPSGNSKVLLHFKNTKTRTHANAITAMSMFLLILMLFKWRQVKTS